MINNFIILILTHFVSDWFFQPAKWGNNKIKNFKPRLYHSIQYAVIFLPVLYFLNINLLWSLWLFMTHLIIDSYKFVNWWNKSIRGDKKSPIWICTIQDQVIHVLLLIPLII